MSAYPQFHRERYLSTEGAKIIVESYPYGQTWPIRTVIDTDSQAVRSALLRLGWTAPAYTDGFLGAG